jgi:hypothetical protein
VGIEPKRWIWIVILVAVGFLLFVAIRETTARRDAVRARNAEQPPLAK